VEQLIQRVLSNMVAIFPFLELCMTFSTQLVKEDYGTFHIFYITYIYPLVMSYHNYNFIWFGIMLGIFQVAIESRIDVPHFVRYNFIQYATLSVAFTLSSLIYNYTWLSSIENTILGIFIVRTWFLFGAGVILYCFIMVIFGKYPTIPIISEATVFNIQRSKPRDEDSN
jgi:hypothetical protein